MFRLPGRVGECPGTAFVSHVTHLRVGANVLFVNGTGTGVVPLTFEVLLACPR